MAATQSASVLRSDIVVGDWDAQATTKAPYPNINFIRSLAQHPSYDKRRLLLRSLLLGQPYDQSFGGTIEHDYTVIVAEGQDTWFEPVFQRLYGMSTANYPSLCGDRDLVRLLEIRASMVLQSAGRRRKDYFREPRFVQELDALTNSLLHNCRGLMELANKGITVESLTLRAAKMFPRKQCGKQGVVLEAVPGMAVW
ncbi:hypothetical protein LTR17_005442 [Elasticomyces elasticus]|nr:hypothetical protein LTR17_005442 [Elasticomyces elasticus]